MKILNGNQESDGNASLGCSLALKLFESIRVGAAHGKSYAEPDNEEECASNDRVKDFQI